MADNNDFQTALMTELGVEPTPDPTPDPTPAPDPEPTPEPAPTPPPADPAPDPTPDLVPDPEPDKQETAEEKAEREAREAADLSAEPEPVKPLSKDDLLAALNERDSAVTARVDQVKHATEVVIEKLYPEGIDKNIYDTDGNIIKTAQDIVDRGLVNPNTNEAFTYEQAASFMLEAGRKMTENIEQLNSYATEIAEKNVSLLEGNDRVIRKWGDVLATLSKDTVEGLAKTYIDKQVKFDKSNSYITEMAMTPEDFYDIALAPYTKLNEALAKQAELEAKVQAAEAAAKAQEEQDEQAERTGSIPPQRGTSETKPNTGDPMLDALVEEINKG